MPGAGWRTGTPQCGNHLIDLHVTDRLNGQPLVVDGRAHHGLQAHHPLVERVEQRELLTSLEGRWLGESCVNLDAQRLRLRHEYACGGHADVALSNRYHRDELVFSWKWML